MSSKQKKQYTDAEKLAYYKKKASQDSRKKAPVKRKTTRALAPRGRAGLLRGYGDYDSPGGLIGGKVGQWLGTRAGHGLQMLATKLMGFGDYSVQENTLFQGGMSPPEVVNSMNNGEVIVRHREYLGELEGSIAFTRQDYFLNPGLHATFPWLASFASSFEEFRMRGAVVEFVSTSSDSVLSTSANTSLGSVEIATQYNSTETLFNSKAQMLNHEFGTSSKPSCSQIHPIECKNDRTPLSHLYVRNGPVPASADERMYDLGVVCIATEGQQADGGSLGEIWISYEVGLFKPRLPEISPSDLILSDLFLLGGWDGTKCYGSTSFRSLSSTLGGTINQAGTIYTFPKTVEIGSTFEITMLWIGATAAVIDYPSRTHTGCSDLMIYEGGANTIQICPASGTSSGRAMMSWCVVITDPSNATIALTGTNTLPAGANQPCDMVITQFNSGVAPGPHIQQKQLLSFETISSATSTEDEYVKVRRSDLKKLGY